MRRALSLAVSLFLLRLRFLLFSERVITDKFSEISGELSLRGTGGGRCSLDGLSGDSIAEGGCGNN